MINNTTIFKLDGISMIVRSCKRKNNAYIIEAEPYVPVEISIEPITSELLSKIWKVKSKKDISESIVDWFLRCKAILRQNVDLLPSVKKDILGREIRRIEREGETWHTIISVLNYSFQDQFWKENLVKCYKSLANKDVRSGIPIYWQLKDGLTKENENNV